MKRESSRTDDESIKTLRKKRKSFHTEFPWWSPSHSSSNIGAKNLQNNFTSRLLHSVVEQVHDPSSQDDPTQNMSLTANASSKRPGHIVVDKENQIAEGGTDLFQPKLKDSTTVPMTKDNHSVDKREAFQSINPNIQSNSSSSSYKSNSDSKPYKSRTSSSSLEKSTDLKDANDSLDNKVKSPLEGKNEISASLATESKDHVIEQESMDILQIKDAGSFIGKNISGFISDQNEAHFSSISNTPQETNSKPTRNLNDSRLVCKYEAVSEFLQKHTLGHLKRNKTPLDSYEKIFEYAEEHGILTVDMLVDLSSRILLESIYFSPSFSTKFDPCLSFLGKSPISEPERLTKLFYHHQESFKGIKALDFTNVPLTDDALRYLIKLSKLEALGLSGTQITTKGIKYLAKYAEFKSSLRYLKLCYVENLNENAISFILEFKELLELDLLGTKISLTAIKGLLEYQTISVERNDHSQQPYKCFFILSKLKTLRIPHESYSVILSLHSSYQLLRSQSLLPSFSLEENPEAVYTFDKKQLVQQLKFHRLHYNDIFLNLSTEQLRERLKSILISRLKEEKLWSIL